jgi:hypothetical protein
MSIAAVRAVHRRAKGGALRSKLFLSAILSLTVLTDSASSLEYPGTCRGATAVITEISGLDSAKATITARYTYPDAISYCYYSLGRSAGKPRPTSAAVASCASKFMHDLSPDDVLHAEANCQMGIFSTSGPKWSNAYKLPLQPMCGNDNNQAISLFRTLCPSYEGQIETDQQ